MLFVRGVGPIGYPGGAEVVNMQPPAALIKRGIHALPCIGDGRQSGTSGSPSILNASPEAAADGGLALLKTGDRVPSTSTRARAEHPDQRQRNWPSAGPRWKAQGRFLDIRKTRRPMARALSQPPSASIRPTPLMELATRWARTSPATSEVAHDNHMS